MSLSLFAISSTLSFQLVVLYTTILDLFLVLEEYHDLRMVFSKEKALSLPPHHPYDCAINLLSGAALPSSPLYNLPRPEREAMEEYIQESLVAGMIQLSTSLVVFQALVHDVLKKFLLTPWLQRHNAHIDWTR